ncbi:hypothetical protein M426DRAFT_21377 [Hypoxylon sp. CI-4A]|nr:hypothetical protein M426DRAFT_21377 [Hypoxylon sp. CI-4A]
MCFTEYLGYTCGHTSVPVKRPCPLTTQIYNLRSCSNAACRPQLCQTMCFACTRILHGRYINIIEYEHRYMHERGACGCEVTFPEMQQPRVITRADGRKSYPDSTLSPLATPFTPMNTRPSTPTPPGAFTFSPEARVFHRGAPEHRINHYPSPARASASTLPPLYEEHEHSKGVDISLRTVSQYGAEWRQDHKPLHDNGHCDCEIKFEKYTGHMDVLKEAADNDGDTDTASMDEPIIDSNVHPMPPPSNIGESSFQGARRGAMPPTPTASNASTDIIMPPYTTSSVPIPRPMTSHYWGYVPVHTMEPPSGRPARWACAPHDSSVVNRMQTDNPAVMAQQHASHPLDMQTVWYNPTETPIAGLPVGAGPEGDSHMPPFEECELYHPNYAAGRRPASH